MPKRNTSGSGKKLNYLVMAGHICCDINQGAIAALLPFLATQRGFSYAALTGLVFASNIASAAIQPLFGALGDKRRMPWLMALGIFLAGFGIAGMGFSESYPVLAAFAVLSGVGVAMFHPEGGRLSNLAAGEHKGEGMSIFAVGGNIGFFVGPILAASSVSTFGMRGTLVFLLPVSVCAAVLLLNNASFVTLGSGTEGAADQADAPAGPERWGSFWLAMAVLSLRSILSYGIMSFVPLFLAGQLGQSDAISSLAISLFSIVGAVAAVLSGKCGERVGAVRLSVACLALLSTLLAVFVWNGSVAAAFALTAAMAVGVDLFYAALVAHCMEYVPAHLGMASGLTYGVAVATGGAFEPLLGLAGDTWGVSAAIWLLAGASAVGCALAFALARADRRG